MSFTDPEHLHDAFSAALAAGDVAATLDLYETAAVSAAPDGTEIRGRDDLRTMLTGLATAGNAMSGTQRRTVVVGDLALTSTDWTAEWPDDDGTTTTRRGTTAEVSRRQPDGSWRVVIDSPFFA